MKECSLFQRFLQSCKRPFMPAKPERMQFDQKPTLRSKSKLTQGSLSHKRSLKHILANKTVKQTKKQPQKEELFSTNRCTSAYPPSARTNKQVEPKCKQNFRIEISPRTNWTSVVSPKATPIQKKNIHFSFSPSSIALNKNTSVQEKNRVNLVECKFEKEEEKESYVQGKGFYGEKTRERTVEESMKYVNEERIGLQRREEEEMLGRSRKTVISEESVHEEENIKMQQSIIVIDYFNPKESDLERWGMEIVE